MDKNPVLQLEDISVRVAERNLMHHVSFQLSTGELLGIAAPSGFGKSTLLRTIAGLLPVEQGEIYFQGRHRASYAVPVFRRQVLWVPQQPALLAGSVEMNLRRPFSYAVFRKNVPSQVPEYRHEEVIALLERFKFSAAILAQSVSTLSVGEQQRIGLVRALLLRPVVLMLDEPTSALDKVTRETVEQLIREEAETRGMAAVIVSHDEEQRSRWCDRIVDLSTFGVSE